MKIESRENLNEEYRNLIETEYQKQETWFMNFRQMIWGNRDVDSEKIYLMRCFEKDKIYRA